MLRGVWNIFHNRESVIGFIQPAASGIQFLEGRSGAIHSCCSFTYFFKFWVLQPPSILRVFLCQVKYVNYRVESELKICSISCSRIMIFQFSFSLSWTTFRVWVTKWVLSKEENVLRYLEIERRFISCLWTWMKESMY